MSHLMNSRVLLYPLIALALFTAAGVGYAVFSPKVGKSQDKATEAFQKGYWLYQDYQYDASKEFFRESLSHNPEFHLARRMLGQALYFSGQVDQAMSQWQVILDQGGYDPILRKHMQNLGSVRVNEKTNWTFRRVVESKQGYRYTNPTFVGTLPNHNVFLLSLGQLDVGNMLELNADGEFARNLRRLSGKLGSPMGAAAGEDYLWVSDFEQDRIHRLQFEGGQPLPLLQAPQVIGQQGTEPGSFLGPAGLCYHDNSFYLADAGNHRIQKLKPNGEFVFSFNKVKAGFRLNGPFGVACSKDGTIYVSEPEEDRISVFDEFGNFKRYMGEKFLEEPRHVTLASQREKLLIADAQKGVFIVDLGTGTRRLIEGYKKQNGNTQPFSRPYSAAIDAFGNLYVADYGAHELIQFVPEQFLYSNLELWVERVHANGFPMVGLYLSVQDQYGNYITDLSADNFTIWENDANVGRLRADYLEQFDIQASWAVLLSRTKSMKNYQDSLPWVMDFLVDPMRERDQVKVVSYGNSYREESPFTNSRLRIRQAVNETGLSKSNSAKALGRGMYQTLNKLLPKKGKRALVWLTDGSLPDEGLQEFGLRRLQNFARINHIPIYVISFENPDVPTPKQNKKRLQNFAEATGGAYYPAFEGLEGLKEKIREKPRERYVVHYRSNANSNWQGQYMDLRVEVNFQGRRGIETSGYFIPEE